MGEDLEEFLDRESREELKRIGRRAREIIRRNHMNNKARTEHTARSYEAHRTEVYENRAREIHEQEQACRNRPRIQPSEIDYVKNASNADLDTFLRLV